MANEHPFHRNRELGAKYARFISESSVMELLLSGAFAASICDQEGKITNAVFHHARMLSDRHDLLNDTLECLPNKNPYKKPILDLSEDIKCCIAMRNKLAHGVIGESKNGDMMLFVWLTSKNRKTLEVPLSIKFLDDEINRLRRVNRTLTDLGLVAHAERVISVARGTLK